MDVPHAAMVALRRNLVGKGYLQSKADADMRAKSRSRPAGNR